MKKIIVFLLIMIMVPLSLITITGLFSDRAGLGRGGYTLESRLLGKEIQIETEGLYKSIDVEEYVLGVLAGTISADYDIEALKVQAILVRTNVLKEMQEKNTTDAADLSYHYLTMEERIVLWGEQNYEKYEDYFERAVVDTAGKVIKQEDSLIMALYHEVSIGKTASAKEILGEEVSYLQSVDSSLDVEAKNYMNLVVYTWEELGQMLNKDTQENTAAEGQTTEGQTAQDQTGEAAPDPAQEQAGEAVSNPAQESDGQKIPITVEESTENGFVKKVSVNGTGYTGEEAMELFSLASMNFYVEEVEGGIRFVCLGKGNCLGLSQYGANRMALDGKKAEEIIKYYYQGVSVVDFSS